MSGNTFGTLLKITTFGESHGAAVGVVVDGVPPQMALSVEDIQRELDKRRPGQSSVTTQRKESDTVEIVSGIIDDSTTGMPIAMIVRNNDARSQDYTNIKDVFRPGHADFTYQEKYGIRDYRGSGRSSGRETIGRVAAGAIAKKILAANGISVIAYTASIGDIAINQVIEDEIEKNIVRSPDPDAAQKMIAIIEDAKNRGDSIGGTIRAVVRGCPAGYGDPVFEKLDARLAAAVMSIGGICGVEIGAGFSSATMRGSGHNDAFVGDGSSVKTETNYAGGILGGISNGQDITLRVAVKPPSSIAQEQKTVDINGTSTTITIEGRHDPCICPRVVPVVEAMIALTIADCLLIQKSVR